MFKEHNQIIDTVQDLNFTPVIPWSGELPPQLGLYKTYLQVESGTGNKFCQTLLKQNQENNTSPFIKFYDAHGIKQTTSIVSATNIPSPFLPKENKPDVVKITVWLTKEQLWSIYPNLLGLMMTTDISY